MAAPSQHTESKSKRPRRLPSAAGSVARRDKRAAVLTVIRMVQGWICDGCPTGDDSGNKYSEEEAQRILRQLDARMWELRDRQPNVKIRHAEDNA